MFYDFWKKKKRTVLGSQIVEKISCKLARIVYENFKDKKNMLEIGPGNGIFLKYISKYNFRYTAIEPNKELSDVCRKIYKKAVMINTLIPPIKLKSSTYDIVYVGHVLEHLADYKEVIYALNEIHRILKKDGVLVIFFPDYLYHKADYFEVDYSHEYILTTNRLKYLLLDSSFSITKLISFNGYFTGILRFFLLPVFYGIKFFFGFLYSIFHMEIFFKVKITFGKNILVFCKKA